MNVPDKDRPSTWVKYRAGLCDNCQSGCCTMPVEVKIQDLIRMKLVDQDEIQDGLKKVGKRLMREGVVKSFRAATGLFMLEQRPDGDCRYLDVQTRRCTIYDLRPDTCRAFPAVGPRAGFCPSRSKANSLT